MSQPLPYERDYSFAGFQSGHPKTPLPGDKVDAELDQVAATMDEVLERIAILQRDDLALASKSVGYDQLKDEISLGFNAPTVWATGTAYVVGDTVFEGVGFYRCLAAHTSGTFATDLASDDWELLADFALAIVAAGGMTQSVYDPQGIIADVFARANHTGTQLAATISNFSAAADARIAAAVGVTVQAFDADLAAIAALTTTSFGRSLLTKTAAEDVRTSLSVGPYVATRTAMKALDTTKDTTAILTEQGREGVFQWRAGNFASVIAADVAEGLYVKANAIASTAGAWVRQREDLDVMLDWFGTATGAAAGANAAANDAAFASARALANVFTIKYSGFIYEHATTLTLHRSNLSIRGYSGFPVFGTGGATTTIIKWTGADAGLMLQIREASGNDCNNNTVEGIEFDGNFLAALGVDVVNTQFATVRKCSIHNMKTAGVSIGLRTGTTAVAGTGVNCCYRGRFEDITIGVTNNGVGVYATGTSGVGNTTFCVFENIHVTHKDGAGFYLVSCDDVTFVNCATSRIAAGTGNGLTFDGTGATWVVGNQFYGFHAGVTDGVAVIAASGVKARQNKIYGLSGVDNNPTISIAAGAHLQYDFLGTGYSSDLATEAAMNRMAAAHITALRLGSDYSTYATATRDVNANDKAILNNPGTGGWERQVGGVASDNLTLGAYTVTSFDAGAGVGPLIELFRDSASPAINDSLGYLYFTGRSSTGVKRTYADLFVTLLDPVNATEDSQITIRGQVAGALTAFVTLTSGGATFISGGTFGGPITSSQVIGGTGVGSSLSLQSTSGVGTTDFINFKVGNAGATEAARFTTSGQMLIGSTVSYATFAGAVTPQFQMHGTTGNQVAQGIYNWGATAGGANQIYSKSRSGTVGTRGIVSANDSLVSLIATADDGVNFIEAARIQMLVDGTPGVNDMPGRMGFFTTPDGAAAVVERVRIDNTGFVSVLGGSFGRGAPVTKTADFTVAATENWLINNKAAATCTVTLPAAASFTGREITINNYQAFTVVSASANVVPLVGGAAAAAILAATAGKWATLVSNGANWVIMAGN